MAQPPGASRSFTVASARGTARLLHDDSVVTTIRAGESREIVARIATDGVVIPRPVEPTAQIAAPLKPTARVVRGPHRALRRIDETLLARLGAEEPIVAELDEAEVEVVHLQPLRAQAAERNRRLIVVLRGDGRRS